MSHERRSDVKKRLPAGAAVSGTVVAHQPFGFFVTLDGFEDVNALVEINEYSNQLGNPIFMEDFPSIGSKVSAKVLCHAERAQQIRLSHVELV